ncbi:Inositol-pentakisphosphate 2-kinase [Pseudocercospora fuligena]|uniref:Inositol-pentakisphosphate 2-kinase n=1 Tax=Pseudocercospora fuligena TaxID=685502 RepID=A0A8H6VMZ8_9PEZI|nr:Inositol-pentakisphosphate 2-kinase [Pseudocercospora fuligena]
MSIPVWFVERGGSPRLCAFEPPTTTASRCVLEYLNEGGANFVYQILPLEEEELLPPRLQGKLLRLRKDLSHVQTAEEQLEALDTNFRALFPPDNLVQHELIRLDHDVLNLLNRSLQDVVRPRHRSDDLLPAGDISGLLVTDMTPITGELLLQLKPKWLAQSPNAPPGSKRCRTCAVRSHRASQRIRTATDAQESCPLDLLNINIEERKRAVHAITPDRRLQEYLFSEAQPLLHQLRSCQTVFDPYGILRTSGADQVTSLCKAMTLRDCTLFLRRSGDSVEARLGDLDLKQPEKLARWKKVESDLINGGWYTNTEHSDHWIREKICLLSRT